MKKITIYSTPTCIYCRMAKDFLAEKNIPFTDCDLTQDVTKREEIIKKTVPNGGASDRGGWGVW